MNPNVVIDNEFEAGEANAIIWNRLEIEGQLGVAYVHSDLDRDLWQVPKLKGGHLCLEQPLVDMSFVALCARNRDCSAIGHLLGRITASNHRRNA